jgi:hypothetical protein
MEEAKVDMVSDISKIGGQPCIGAQMILLSALL